MFPRVKQLEQPEEESSVLRQSPAEDADKPGSAKPVANEPRDDAQTVVEGAAPMPAAEAKGPEPASPKGKSPPLPHFPAPGGGDRLPIERLPAEKLPAELPTDKVPAAPAEKPRAEKPPAEMPTDKVPAPPAEKLPAEKLPESAPKPSRQESLGHEPAATKPAARFEVPEPQRAGARTVPFELLVVGSLLLAFSQVMHGSGWPMSHEGTGWLQRMNVIRNGLSHGDIFPLWWAEGAWGLGSPMPLLYHKLFNFIAAPISLVFGDIKEAVLLALAILSAVGIYGLRRLCEQVTAPGIIPNLLALSFPHLSYAVTDWLVRGSFAEYGAMAVGTWLLAWCTTLVRTGHVSRTIVPTLVCLFLAHSVIAMYGLLFVVVAVILWASRPTYLTKDRLRQLGLAGGLCLAILGPLLVLMGAVSGRVNTAYLDSGIYHPVRQYWDLHRYLWDANFVWGADWRTYTVQLDTVLLLALLVAGVALAVHDLRSGKVLRSDPDLTSAPTSDPTLRPLFFIVISLLIIAFLQSRASAGYYNYVPGAALIQFPWRLLSFAAPLLVALVCWTFFRLEDTSRGSGVRAAVATAILLLVMSPALRPIQYDRLPENVLTSDRMPPRNEWREYWPGRADGSEQVQGYIRDLAHQGVSDVAKGHCTGAELTSDEYLVRKFSVRCKAQSTVALPVASYGLSTVRDDKSRLKQSSEGDDPRMRVELPAGEHVLKVKLPTIWRILPAIILG